MVAFAVQAFQGCIGQQRREVAHGREAAVETPDRPGRERAQIAHAGVAEPQRAQSGQSLHRPELGQGSSGQRQFGDRVVPKCVPCSSPTENAVATLT